MTKKNQIRGIEKFDFKIPDGREISPFEDCGELHEVHHVTHLEAAQRILADGAIKPKRIRDQSVLNDTRLKVVWLSANNWYRNYVYGNVQFTFDWVDILKKRKLFWVEPTPENRSHGFRILVANEILNKILSATQYDPSRCRGPVKRQGSSWYRKSSLTCEFMLAAKIPLELCKRIHLVKHDICRLGSRCPDSGLADWESTARLMAFALGKETHSADKSLLFEEGPEIPIQIQNGVLVIGALLGSDRLSYSGETNRLKSHYVWALGHQLTKITQKPLLRC